MSKGQQVRVGNVTLVFTGSPWQAGNVDYAVAVIPAAHNKKKPPHSMHPNKSIQIQSRREEVSFANPVSQLFCNLTHAQIVASRPKK